jgi:ankyrin repeat protein
VNAGFLVRIMAAAALGLLAVPAAAQQLSESTQFIKAVKDRDADKVMSLLSAPGSIVINSRNEVGDGALHMLVRERDMTWMGYLLNKGAKPDLQNREGMTPLAVAAQIGWVEGADRLLRGGAKIDFPNRNGETPLILAVHNRDIAMARLLLGRGANPNKTDTVTGHSALDYARQDGRATPLVKLLESAAAPKPATGPS